VSVHGESFGANLQDKSVQDESVTKEGSLKGTVEKFLPLDGGE